MDAAFRTAVALVLKHEKGYVNHPNDPGGETNWGVSKRSYPAEDIKNMTPARATEIYYRDFWLPSGCNVLPKHLQNIHLDTAVNCGIPAAVRILQRAAETITVDGRFGEKTRQAAEFVPLEDYIKHRLEHYERLVLRNNKLRVFMKGWTNRTLSFRKP